MLQDRGSRGAPRSPGPGRRHPEPQSRSPGRPRPCSCSSQRRFPQGEPREGARSPGDAAGLWDRCVWLCRGAQLAQGPLSAPGCRVPGCGTLCPNLSRPRLPAAWGCRGVAGLGSSPPAIAARSRPAGGARGALQLGVAQGRAQGIPSGFAELLGDIPGREPSTCPGLGLLQKSPPGTRSPSCADHPPPQAVQAASLRLPFVKASCNPTAPEAVSEEKVLAKEATWENKENCAVKKAK